jgi:outer membrane protein OmpU
MKKLLLVSTAIAGVALLSSPASAALKMDLGGYFDGYGVYSNNNPAAGVSLHQYNFRQQSDLFVNGESTLDNGLTIGAHSDIALGNNTASGTTNTGTNTVTLNQEYAYGSGGWGRVNLGVSDGAAYLLQVAAPSADSNIDGIRTSIQALNPLAGTAAQDTRLNTLLGNTGAVEAFGASTNGDLGYAQDDFRQTTRITYLTPKFNGFQAGASYAPTQGISSATSATSQSNLAATPGLATTFKNLWEAGARWDGEFQGVAGSLGAGYSGSSLGDALVAPTTDALELTNGIKSWNVGGNLSTAGFSLGAIYKESKVNEEGLTNSATTPAAVASGTVTDKTYDVGLGYDNGPYHAGASYLHDRTNDPFLGPVATGDWDAGDKVTVTRYTLGGGYTFAPGMTFRGSVAWGKFEGVAVNGTGVQNGGGAALTSGSNRYDQVAIGTDIQF